MTSPATQFVDSLLKELHERALDRTRDDSVQAARTILAYDIWHKRAAIYEKRCEILNERTARTPVSAHKNSSASSLCDSVSSVVNDFVPTKGDPKKKKPFGAQLSPGDTDPHTGWVVPEEHICQIRKDAPENHVMAHCMLPGYKTKADLERAVYTFIDRDNRIYNELKAAQSELNVFRSERLGSISLEKREELLAGRFEKNNKRREVYGTPTFLAELKELTPELLAAKPVPTLEELSPVPTPYPERERAGSSPSTSLSPTSVSHSLPSPTGEMSRGSASDREGVSHSPNEESSRRAGREGASGGGSSPSTSPSPISDSISASASASNNPSPSVISVFSVVKEVLSEKAAARRAAGKRPLPPLPVRLNHPPPPTPRAPRPPRDNCYNYLYPDST